jgi:hypothetical protein
MAELSRDEVAVELRRFADTRIELTFADRERIRAIAAAVASWCVRDHSYEAVSMFTGEAMGDGRTCLNCGQRREDARESGR